MNPLVPHLKLRVLRLEDRRTYFGMLPIFELLLIVKSENVFDLEAFGPRIDEALFWSTEMILIMALTADKRAHLLTSGLLVHVVVLDALGCFESAHPLYESRACYSQLHRRGVDKLNPSAQPQCICPTEL